MEKISLADFVKSEGQAGAAQIIGVHQTAISKALRAGRKIFITRLRDGSLQAEECRPFPSIKNKNV